MDCLNRNNFDLLPPTVPRTMRLRRPQPAQSGLRGGIEDSMTSEPDSTPRRKPPTIDLTATEVPPEKPAATTDSAPTASAGEAAGKPAEATARPRSGASA